jgi:predicted P-loop ATPase
MADRKLSIARAKTAKAAKWQNTETTWEAFLGELKAPRRTSETLAEYRGLTKADQAQKKDGPAYVGGYLADGRRKKGSVVSRSLLALDADSVDDADGLRARLEDLGHTAFLHTTHSSGIDGVKMRVVLPLGRDVTPEEYMPLALKVMESLGLKCFDLTCAQPERLMYMPSLTADAPEISFTVAGSWVDPDAWLSLYPDWRDASTWPVEGLMPKAPRAKAEDPHAKPGVIGAFNRIYDVHKAIGEHLSDIYAPTTDPDRYTYVGGSAYGGLVVYDRGLWAYSNHATDPAGGRLCNAYDLVRIHHFGSLDDEVRPGRRPSEQPSMKAMGEWALSLEAVSIEVSRARLEEARADFTADDTEEADNAWLAGLSKDHRTGAVLPTAPNLNLIMASDARLKGRIRKDVASGRILVVGGDLPWRKIAADHELWADSDAAFLRAYLESHYGLYSRDKTRDALVREASANPYDPVRAYLEALPAWDGRPRLETLLIDLMGAADEPYTRAVTKKTLVAAVRRVLRPGYKWDQMLILEGDQGIGKSSLFQLLAGEWFSDSLTLADLSREKTAAEKLQGAWITEVAELDGIAKAEIERLKSFISATSDRYRAAYAEVTEDRPRRGIIVGTVNNLDGYLRDATGNRRFWPVYVTRPLDRRRLSKAEVAQIWAEAMLYDLLGEEPYLSRELEEVAQEKQREAMEEDPRESIIQEYLSVPIPAGFESCTEDERRAFYDGSETFQACEKRVEVSVIEVWTEALRNQKTKPNRYDSFQIASILKRLGWKAHRKTKRISAFGVVRIYEKP